MKHCIKYVSSLCEKDTSNIEFKQCAAFAAVVPTLKYSLCSANITLQMVSYTVQYCFHNMGRKPGTNFGIFLK